MSTRIAMGHQLSRLQLMLTGKGSAFQMRLAAADIRDGVGRGALAACLEAHLDPEILTVRRAAAWLQFTARVAYVEDYARIHRVVRARQLAALQRAVRPLVRDSGTAIAMALRLATALDGYWMECATREGGLLPGEARRAMDAILSDSVW